MAARVNDFVKRIATTKTGNTLFNPYNELSKGFDDRNAPGIRQQNLRLYLESHDRSKTRTIWVYFKPTYQESKWSGVPLGNSTVFKQIEGILGADRHFEKASKRGNPVNTPLSSSIWAASMDLDVNPIIWPAFPFYSHKKGKTSISRNPTKQEILEYRWFIERIIQIYNPKNILAIGKQAKETLDLLGIKSHYIKHPRKGKAEFKKAVSRFK